MIICPRGGNIWILTSKTCFILILMFILSGEKSPKQWLRAENEQVTDHQVRLHSEEPFPIIYFIFTWTSVSMGLCKSYHITDKTAHRSTRLGTGHEKKKKKHLHQNKCSFCICVGQQRGHYRPLMRRPRPTLQQ